MQAVDHKKGREVLPFDTAISFPGASKPLSDLLDLRREKQIGICKLGILMRKDKLVVKC